MGKYNYDSLKESTQAEQEVRKTVSNYPKIGHFDLWDKKPSAIVRFNINTKDDFILVDVHNTKIVKDGKTTWRNVACLRNNGEPVDKCPLCKKDFKSRSTRIFVEMLEYRVDEEGKVKVYPTVWTRGSNFADELVKFIEAYGDLRDYLFKVTREVTNNRTKFNVMLQPEKGIYTEEAGYVKDFSAFENFQVNKHSYMERTFEELEEFVKTGNMASRKPASEKTTEEVADAVAAKLGLPQEKPVTDTIDTSIQDTTGMENMPSVIREKVEVPGRVEVTTPTNVPVGSTAESKPEHAGKATVSPTVAPVTQVATTTPTPAPVVTPIRERTQEVSPAIVDNNPTTARRRRYNFEE